MICHNVLAWVFPRKVQLGNAYRGLGVDIILLQSHGLAARLPLKIAGYSVHKRNDTGEGNDGVAVAVKHGIRYELIDDFEDEVMAVRVITATGPVVLATCYLPPRRPYIPYPDVLRLLSRREPVYFLGDFNARHAVFGYRSQNVNGTGLHQLLVEGRIDHLGPNFSTYVGYQGSGRPDLVLSNGRTHHCHHITPGPVTTSDHLPIIMDISCDAITIPAPARYVYKRADWPAYTNAIGANTTPLNLDGQPLQAIEDAVSGWYDTLLAAKDAHIPQVQHRPLPHPRKSHLLQVLGVAAKAAWDEGERNGWTPALYHQLKVLQRRLTEESIRLYQEEWQRVLADLTAKYPSQRDWYRELRRLQGTTRTSYLLHPLHQDRKVLDAGEREALLTAHWRLVWQITPEEEASFDRGYFAGVRAQFPYAQDDLAPTERIDLAQLSPALLTTAPITRDELVADLKGMRTGKAPGHLKVTKDDLIHLPTSAIDNLVAIGNACLAAGYWPRVWRHAVVSFIPKKENPHLVENQRPISLLEIPGKLIEKSVNRRFMEHLELGGHLAPSQYGFRQRRGTGKALALIYERCSHAVDQQYHCSLLCRDIRKAFDKLYHEGLRLRLLQLQVPPPLARLLSSFLRGRTASIRVGHHVGPPVPLLSGVPQGSVLSPSLYVSYVSDIPEPQPPSKLSSYADDNILQNVQPSDSRRRLAVRTIRAAGTLNNYEAERYISTNHDKEFLLSVARISPSRVIVHGRVYPFVRVVTILGLRLGRCGFTAQVTHNRGKAYGVLSTLKRFRTLPWRHKLQLYKTLVRPVLEYPAVPLHAGSNSAMRRLQAVQNSAIMWVCGLRFSDPDRPSIPTLHRMLRLEPINVRLHKLACRTWERLAQDEDPNYDEVLRNSAMPQVRRPALGANPRLWWPSSLALVQGPRPAPIYSQAG